MSYMQTGAGGVNLGALDMGQVSHMLGRGPQQMPAPPPYSQLAAHSGMMQAPMAFRAVQGPPQVFQNPIAQMAYGAFAPTIAHAFGAPPGTTFKTVPGPGISGFDAAYSSRITTPYLAGGEADLTSQIAMQMGGGVADVLNRFNMRPKDVHPNDFHADIVDFSGGAFGSFVASQALKLDTVQNIMGGDPLSGYGKLASAGYQLSRAAGEPLSLVKDGKLRRDVPRQAFRHVEEFQEAMTDRIYGYDRPVTGVEDYFSSRALAMTPDMSFTRGFDVGDVMHGLPAYMAKRGFEYERGGRRREFRGSDKDTQLRMVDEQLEMLSAARDLFQSESMVEIEMHLDKLTQGRRHTIDPQKLSQTLDEMAATAIALGVDGRDFMDAALQAQEMLSGSVGLGLGGTAGSMRTASGRIIGGLGSLEVTQAMATDTVALAGVRGDLSKAGVQDANAELQAMFNMGLSSGQGKDILMLEWMRESGMIDKDSDAYRAHREAIASGDKAAQQEAARELFRQSSFGSYEAAQATMRTPGFMLRIAQDMEKGESWNTVRELIGEAQAGEMPERVGQVLAQRGRDQVQQLERMAGLHAPREYTERAQARAMANAVREAGGTEADAALIMEQFESQGMAGVRRALSTDQYAKYRGAAEQASQRAHSAASADYLDSHGGWVGSRISAELQQARTLLGRDITDEQRAAATEVRERLAEGDTEGARAALGRIHAGLTSRQAASVRAAGKRAQDHYTSLRASAKDTRLITQLQRGFALGLDTDEVLDKLGLTEEDVDALQERTGSKLVSNITAESLTGVRRSTLGDMQKAREFVTGVESEIDELVPLIAGERHDSEKLRTEFSQRLVNYLTDQKGVRKTTLADVFLLTEPEKLTEEELSQLTPTELKRYEKRTQDFKMLKDLDVTELQTLTDDEIEKKYGENAERVKQLKSSLKDGWLKRTVEWAKSMGKDLSDAVDESTADGDSDKTLSDEVKPSASPSTDTTQVVASKSKDTAEEETAKTGVKHPDKPTTVQVSGTVRMVGGTGGGNPAQTVDVGDVQVTVG